MNIEYLGSGISPEREFKIEPVDVEERPGVLGEFGRGLEAGVQQLRGFGYGLGALTGEIIESEPIKQWAKKGLIDVEAATPKPAVGSFSDIQNISNLADYLAYGVATNLPNMALSMFGGGAGAWAGRLYIKKVAQDAVKQAVMSAAQKGIAGDALNAIALKAGQETLKKAATTGMIMGAGATSLGMEAGSIAGDQLTETGQVYPGRAIAGAIPAALLDVVPQWYLFKRMGWLGGGAGRTGGRLSYFGKQFGKQFLAEAPTEAMQSVIERASVPGKSISNAESWDEYINSFILGGMTGGVVGGAGGIFTKKAMDTPIQQVLQSDPLAREIENQIADDELIAEVKAVQITPIPVTPSTKITPEVIGQEVFEPVQLRPTVEPPMEEQPPVSPELAEEQPLLTPPIIEGEINLPETSLVARIRKLREIKKRKEPQNLVTFLEVQGKINWGIDYNTHEINQFPDLKRTSSNKSRLQPDEAAMIVNEAGYLHPDGQPFDGDRLAEVLKTNQGRNIFTPDKSDILIERQLRRQENEWIEQQFANHEDAENARGEILADQEHLKRGILDEIEAQGAFEDANRKIIEQEFDDYAMWLFEPPKIQEPVKVYAVGRLRAGEYVSINPSRDVAEEYIVDKNNLVPTKSKNTFRYEPERISTERLSAEVVGEEPSSAPRNKNHAAIIESVKDKPWEWTAEDLIETKLGNIDKRLDKIWGPELEFNEWSDGANVPDKKRYWALIDDAPELERAIRERDIDATKHMLGDIQSRLQPQDYYAYEEAAEAVQGVSGRPVPAPTAEAGQVARPIPEAARTGPPAAPAREISQPSIPGLTAEETFTLTSRKAKPYKKPVTKQQTRMLLEPVQKYAMEKDIQSERRRMPTLEDVKTVFKGQKVIQDSSGKIWIETVRGNYLSIIAVDHIDPDETAIRIAYGKDIKPTEKVTGGYYSSGKEGQIRLVSGVAGIKTLHHESVHFLEDFGIITKAEQLQMDIRIRKDGKWNKDRSSAENRAYWLADEANKPAPNTTIGKIWQKIQDFIDRLLKAFGISSARNVTREMRTGEIYGRTPEGASYSMASPNLYALQEKLKPFFSQLERIAGTTKFTKMPVAQFKAMLSNPKYGVTKAEIENLLSGLEGTVTKQQVLDAIKENTTEFQDVMLGEPLNEQPPTWEQWKDYYGENNATRSEYDDAVRDGRFENGLLTSINLGRNDSATKFDAVTSKGVEGGIPGTYRELTVTMPKAKPERREGITASQVFAAAEGRKVVGHWQDQHPQYSDIPNPVIRIHFDDHVIGTIQSLSLFPNLPAGTKRILFIREMQSIAKTKPAAMTQWAWDRAYDIGVKRMLSYAKENGYDGVAWSTGQIVANRYDLAKQVESISIFRDDAGMYEIIARPKGGGAEVGIASNVPHGKLVDYIGKELISKVEDKPGRQTFTGLDLEIGGEGIKDTYDRRLPGLFKKYGKEGVGTIDLVTDAREVLYSVLQGSEGGRTGINLGVMNTREEAEQIVKNYGGDARIIEERVAAIKEPVPFIPITDKTPASYPQYSVFVKSHPPASYSKITQANVTQFLTDYFDNPQNIPQEAVDAIRRVSQSQSGLKHKLLRQVLSLPYQNAQKYVDWAKQWGIQMNRLETRMKIVHDVSQAASPYFNRHKVLKAAGYNKDQVKDATYRMGRILTLGDDHLRNIVQDLKAEASETGIDPGVRQTLQDKINWYEKNRRYTDEELKEGIRDYDNKPVKLNDLEIELYASARKSEDQLFDTLIDHLASMSFLTYKDQKWFHLLLAAGVNLNKGNIDALLDSGLKGAALTYAKTIQPDLDRIWDRINKGIEAIPESETMEITKLYNELSTSLQADITALRGYISKATGETDTKKLEDITREVFAAYRLTRPHLKKIKTLRNDANQWIGFFPRWRKPGNFKIQIFERQYDEESGEDIKAKELHSEMYDNERQGYELMRKLIDRYGKNGKLPENIYYNVIPVTRTPEGAFQGVNDMNVQKVIDDALLNLRDKKAIDPQTLQDLWQSVYEAVAGQLQSRGAGRTLIHRKQVIGELAIKGYEEENHDQILMDHITSMAGLITKQRAAFESLQAMKDLEDSSLYDELLDYTKGQLRNDTASDRASSKVRAYIFTFYLGGMIRAAGVNSTQPIVVGIPILARYMRTHKIGEAGNAEKYQLKASFDVATGRLSDLDKKVIEEMINTGYMQNQQIQLIMESALNSQYGIGHGYREVIKALAYPFSQVEIFNRKTSGLAMFRTAYDRYTKEGILDQDAYDRAIVDAETFINDVHYPMGKHNLPLPAMTGDITGIGLKTLYTFRTFTHNFLLNQLNLLRTGGKTTAQWTNDFKAVIHTMAYLSLFGGLLGLPFLKDIFRWFEKHYGYSPTRYIRKTLNGIGGDTLEIFGTAGIPALLGANISGSLAIGIPFMGEDALESIGGVYWGQATKLKRAGEAAMRGDKYRILSNLLPEFLRAPIIAAEESGIGRELLGTPGYASTVRGRPIYDESGKPLSMGVGQAAIRALGFQPTEISRQRELTNIAKQQEAWASKKKATAAERYRIARIQKKPDALKTLFRDVKEINEAIRSRGLRRLVPLASVSKVIQSSRQVKTAKEKREMAYKRAAS